MITRVDVTAVAATPRQALDEALTKLAERVARTQERGRDSSRRPKKYYAAARKGAG
jgi:hypothetical protein